MPRQVPISFNAGEHRFAPSLTGLLGVLQRILNVTGDACRSLADLIMHIHDKLAIPMEKEFAIHTEHSEDGASSFIWRAVW